VAAGAYIGTGEVRSFIVPGTPQPDMAVAPNYERFDGLEPLDHPAGDAPFSDYGPAPRDPGTTPLAEQTYTPGPLAGTTNTLGGQPLPVASWRADTVTQQGSGYTPAGARVIGGPKMGRQQNNGIAETIFFADLQSQPPQPGDLVSIMSGQG
jgi:hypothetical protein